MKFNPFSFLFESEVSPHARTLRTNAIEKLRDAYFTFYGNARASREEPRMGIYDWATLFIPAALGHAEVYLKNHTQSRFSFMHSPLYYLNKLLVIPKFIFSLVAAVITAPVTLATAAIVRVIDGDGMDEVMAIEGQQKEGPRIRLGDLMKGANSHMQAMRCFEKTDAHIKFSVVGFGGKGNPHYGFFLPTPTDDVMQLLTRYNIGQINNVAPDTVAQGNEDQFLSSMNITPRP